MMGIVPQWFDKRRGLALGLSASGSGIGGLIMPFIMNALLQKYGAGWTYRIIGFMCLVLGAIATCLVREKYPSTGRKKLSDIVQWSVLRDSNLVLWCVAATITLFGYLVPFFYLPGKLDQGTFTNIGMLGQLTNNKIQFQHMPLSLDYQTVKDLV
jgi:MFS family permease